MGGFNGRRLRFIKSCLRCAVVILALVERKTDGHACSEHCRTFGGRSG